MKKNWKLFLLDAMIEQLLLLISLEPSPIFQNAYLDALEEAMHSRKKLFHS